MSILKRMHLKSYTLEIRYQFHAESVCFYSSVAGKTESRIGIGILEGQKLVNEMQSLMQRLILRIISNPTSLKW